MTSPPVQFGLGHAVGLGVILGRRVDEGAPGLPADLLG